MKIEKTYCDWCGKEIESEYARVAMLDKCHRPSGEIKDVYAFMSPMEDDLCKECANMVSRLKEEVKDGVHQ